MRSLSFLSLRERIKVRALPNAAFSIFKDVKEYEGREVQSIDDGYLSEKHAATAAAGKRRTPYIERPMAAGGNCS